jgi:hypothetical protein
MFCLLKIVAFREFGQGIEGSSKNSVK